MPRRGNESKRGVLRMEVLFSSGLTYTEVRDKVDEALADPHSLLSRALRGLCNYRAAGERFDASVKVPTALFWKNIWSGDEEDEVVTEAFPSEHPYAQEVE
jgi:hypothetical protein